ncbi:MAG: shikimate kinase AroK [Calditrichia bacterium]
MTLASAKNQRYQRITLIGFRGAGKTTLAKRLASLLNWRYISIDQLIEQESGIAIAELVKQKGWDTFRRIESEVIEKSAGERGIVIDCGGGVVERKENMRWLVPKSLVVWVDAPPEIIYRRLKEIGDRPLLNQKDLKADIVENYFRRLPFYRRYGMIRVDTAEQSVAEICEHILKKFKSA